MSSIWAELIRSNVAKVAAALTLVGWLMSDILEKFPPLVQVIVLASLAFYVAVSVAGRLSSKLGKLIWDPEKEPSSVEHYFQYTITPILVLGAALFFVYQNWRSTTPWLGSWTLLQFVRFIGMFYLGMAATVTGRVLASRWDISNAKRLVSWVPLGLIVSGLSATILAVLTIP